MRIQHIRELALDLGLLNIEWKHDLREVIKLVYSSRTCLPAALKWDPNKFTKTNGIFYFPSYHVECRIETRLEISGEIRILMLLTLPICEDYTLQT